MQAGSDQYFGYMTAPATNGTQDILVHHRPADAKTIAEFEELTRIVTRLQPLVIAFGACDTEFDALAQWPSDEQRRLTGYPGPDLPVSLVNDLIVESVRRVNAYLASASSLIGQAIKHVSDHFDSDSADAWNKLRQDLHASSLGFRILYELRNYAQHFALPVSGVRVTGQANPNGGMAFECGAFCEHRKALASGYSTAAG